MFACDFEILCAEATAPAYDPARSNNGGSYFQPCGTVVFKLVPTNRRVIVEVDDQSCGDFGRRVRYTVYSDGKGYRFDDDAMDRRGFCDEGGDFEDVCKLGNALNIDLFGLLEAALSAIREVAAVEGAEEEI